MLRVCSSVALLLAVGACAASVVVGCGDGDPDTPEAVVLALVAALEDEDHAALYDLFTVETQLHLDEALQRAAAELPDDEATHKAYGAAPAKLAELAGRELFVRMLEASPAGEREPFVPRNFDDDGEPLPPRVDVVEGPQLDETGTRAHVTLRLASGDEHQLRLLRENERWAVDGTSACGATPGGTAAAGTLLCAGLLLVLLMVRRTRRQMALSLL